MWNIVCTEHCFETMVAIRPATRFCYLMCYYVTVKNIILLLYSNIIDFLWVIFSIFKFKTFFFSCEEKYSHQQRAKGMHDLAFLTHVEAYDMCHSPNSPPWGGHQSLLSALILRMKKLRGQDTEELSQGEHSLCWAIAVWVLYRQLSTILLPLSGPCIS